MSHCVDRVVTSHFMLTLSKCYNILVTWLIDGESVQAEDECGVLCQTNSANTERAL
jgi:hypothetical protein